MKFKRLIAICAAICIFCTATASFAQEEYMSRGEVADMLLRAADDYNESVERSDIIKGYEDGSLHEDKYVTRAEALVMLKRAFGSLPESVGHNARVALKSEDFTDVPTWAQQEIGEVFDRGIVGGTAKGIFSPNDYVTHEQMTLFVQRVYALFGTNIKDDFYAGVNKETLEKLEITQGNVIAGPIFDLQGKVSGQLRDIVLKAVRADNKEGTPKQKIADFYNCILDESARNKEGIKPVAQYLDRIENAKNISELARIQNILSQELCLNPYICFGLTVDIQNSSEYMLAFRVMSPLMNKEVYLGSGDITDAYKEYIETLLILGGESEEKARENAHSFFKLEKALAENMLDLHETSNVDVIYNVFTYNKISTIFPDFDMEQILRACGLEKEDRILVKDIKLTECFAELFNQSNFEALKTAAKISLLDAWGHTLNEEFSQAQDKLNSKLLGTKDVYTIEQRALLILQETMPDYLGKVYAENCFEKKSKQDIENMVADIISVFKERIQSLSWMSSDTKEKALCKLETMRVKIGYPATYDMYLDDVQIKSPKKGGTYFSNMLALNKEAVKHYSMLQGTKVDRDMWDMYPYTVNACYNPTNNDITLPAAMLQSPLYDANNTYEENLGGIGYVIAHEITHAFDNIGARFDENGNVSEWWSEEDYAAFEKLCDEVIAFFDGCEAIAAIPTDGVLTLSENVADLGGAACITQLASKREDTDYRLLYTSMAKALASTKTREFALLESQTDVHADEKLRINRILVNFEEFYDAFDISEGDGMYVTPENRIKIW